MSYDICAGILAGGKSTRMGTDKAMLAFSDHCFLEQTLQSCSIFPEILVSVADPEAYPGLSAPCVPDVLPDFGPMEGIYQLLSHCRSPYLLAVAIDMPLLTPAFLQALANCVEGMEDCLVLRVAGNAEPLCSIYGKTALPALAALRQEHCHRVRALFDRVNTHYVDGEALGMSLPFTRNINTPQEYESLCLERQASS